MRAKVSLALLGAAAIILAAAPHANATLVYQKGLDKLSVWVARDDGGGPRKLAKGAQPRIAPDGSAVIFVANANTAHPSLREIPMGGGAARMLVPDWTYGVSAWSADSRYFATLAGPEIGRQRLVLIDLASGAERTIARGSFSGASFSSGSDALVYSKDAKAHQVFPNADLYVAPVAGGTPRAITSDGRGLYPVWGPDRIACVRYARPTGKHRHDDGPKFNLWTLKPDGSGRRRLTDDKVPFLLTGLTPTVWSADGSELLAQFNGQDTTYAVTVDPATGRERIIGKARLGLFATALSRDGSTVLGATGLDGGLNNTDVYTASYAGGKPRIIVHHASNPDWNR